jgi:deazaflavin-dependent oxidoreductase (nitroreductase family)
VPARLAPAQDLRHRLPGHRRPSLVRARPTERSHAAVRWASRGSLAGPPSLLLLLNQVGAKSGKLRTTLLVYMPDGESFVVVASKGGHPKHGWLHNLRAHPDAEVKVGKACEGSGPRGRRLAARSSAQLIGCASVRARPSESLATLLLSLGIRLSQQC